MRLQKQTQDWKQHKNK